MTVDNDTDQQGNRTDERGKPLTHPDDINRETAYLVIDALDLIFDDGDWWRIKKAVSNLYKQRNRTCEYTDQDRNLDEKIQRLQQLKEERKEYERLKSLHTGSEE